MHTHTTRAIILKRRNFGEADRILTVFTQKLGKVSVKAKGVRKPLSKLGGNIELFMESSLRLAEGRTWLTLTESSPMHVFANIREDLHKTSQAYFVAEVTDSLTKEHEHQPSVYELLWQTFSILNTANQKLLLPVFVWKLLAEIGYRPELYRCVESHEKLEPDNLLFSAELGGLLDKKHKEADVDAFAISKDTVKFMRIILQDIGFLHKVTLSSETEHEFRQAVDVFSKQVLSHEPKSLKFIKEMYPSTAIHSPEAIRIKKAKED